MDVVKIITGSVHVVTCMRGQQRLLPASYSELHRFIMELFVIVILLTGIGQWMKIAHELHSLHTFCLRIRLQLVAFLS